MATGEATAAVAARRTRRRWWPYVLAFLVLVAAAGMVARWRLYPSNRIERELDALDLPGSLTQTDTRRSDQGWICISSCSSETRYYVTTLPDRAAVEAAAAALTARGFTVERVQRCPARGTRGTRPYEVRECTWMTSYVSKDGFIASARSGPRVDGRPGLQIEVSASG